MCEYLEFAVAAGVVGWVVAAVAIMAVYRVEQELKDANRAWAAEVDERAWGHRDGNA